MNFDPYEVKKAAPGSVFLFDDYPGLRLVTSQKNRAWIYRYKSPLDGRMKQVRIGLWPGMGHIKAAGEWGKLKEIRDNGGDPSHLRKVAKVEAKRAIEAEKDAARTNGYTVTEMCDFYLDGYIKHRRTPKGAKYVENLFKRNLGDLGAMPVCSLTKNVAYGKIEKIATVGQAPVVAKNLLLELAAATEYAWLKDKIVPSTVNWWRKIKEVKMLETTLESKGKKIGGEHVGQYLRVLNTRELSLLIPWLPNFSQAVNDALVLYLWTGARGAEIMQIEGREVGYEDDGVLWWTCPKRKTKNRKRKYSTDFRVPLFGRAAAVILRRKERYGEGYLWPSERSKLQPFMEQESIGNRVREHQPRNIKVTGYPVLPVTDWSPHDLRRTARTLLSTLGCPKDVAECVLGHMPSGIAKTYDRHSYDPQRRVWLERLSGHLEVLAKN